MKIRMGKKSMSKDAKPGLKKDGKKPEGTSESWLESIRNRGFNTRVMLIVVISTTASILLTALISFFNMNSIMGSQNATISSNSLATLQLTLDNLRSEEQSRAEQIAANYQILTRLKEDNPEAAKTIFDLKSSRVSYIHQVITDEEGNIFGSNSSVLTSLGNVRSLPLWQEAMRNGNSTVKIAKSDAFPMAIFAVAPILDENGSLYGSVVSIYDLQSTNSLETLKKTTAADFSIYLDDNCVNSTVAGKDAILAGTKLNSNIASKVLENKESYYTEEKILGVSYAMAYAPLVADDGSVIGVLAAGNDLTSMNYRKLNSYVTISFFIVFSVTVTAILANLTLRNAVRIPLQHMIKILDHIAKGEIDMELKGQLKTIHSHDEIRTMSISINSVVNSIYNMSQDTAVLKEAAMQKDLRVKVDADRYFGIYHDIIFTVNQLFEELTHVVRDITTISEEIANGATSSTAASNSLADGTMRQAKITEDLARAIQDITNAAQRNLETSSQASASMNNTKQSIDDSNRKMMEVMDAMNDIEQKSLEISKIARTIDDIAFQTNILALNAAIEAARAGQYGKGFAVVADEVRNLAIKSADAAKSVGELIEKTTTAIDQCTTVTKDTEVALREAVANSDQALQAVENIADATNSQYQSIEEISKGMGHISEIVQNNAAIAEETAASSVELEQQAEQLKELVEEYKVNM